MPRMSGHFRTIGTACAVAALLSGATVALALPAFSGDSVSTSAFSDDTLRLFTPAGLDSQQAERFQQAAIATRGKFRFTPAGVDQARSRTLTVAVRASSPESRNAVSVRDAIASTGSAGSGSKVALKATSYELGKAKGWTSFALPTENKPSNTPVLGELGTGSGFTLDESKPRKRSKFNTRMTLDSREQVKAAPRPLDGERDYALDVGGSYAITKGVDVTAGVRYKSERDAPLVDEQRDSQAVYVGTLIRF